MRKLWQFIAKRGNQLSNDVAVQDRSFGPLMPPMLIEAHLAAASDIDAIWYYERLKWKAQD